MCLVHQTAHYTGQVSVHQSSLFQHQEWFCFAYDKVGGEWDRLREHQRAPPCLDSPYLDGSVVQGSFVFGILQKDQTTHPNPCSLTAARSIFHRIFYNIPVIVRAAWLEEMCPAGLEDRLLLRHVPSCLRRTKHLERRVTIKVLTGRENNKQTTATTGKENNRSVLSFVIHLVADPLPDSLQPVTDLCPRQTICPCLF